ncbi:MAG: MerR family transcriptional regulator [Bacteroidales bacterium]|jgi:DNA-binding transcriptional MerR regulator|nr:MerR family transcriptional regulator [Bacteroidales bacterium]
MPYKEKKVEKLYYSIGEAANILEVPVSTVRFWEREFDILKPKRNNKGNRLFYQADIDNLRKIHFLLKEKGMTLDGARRVLSGGEPDVDQKLEAAEKLREIRAMLVELIDSF